MKILMVCLGNICRSPLAEGILKHKIEQEGLPIHVDSAGTGFWHVGQKPDKRSIQVAAKYGIDITYQRARLLKKSDLDTFDIIYAMDENNYKDIVKMAERNEQKSKVKLIMNEVFENENMAVPDPYYGGEKGFEEVFKMLDEATERILEKLRK